MKIILKNKIHLKLWQKMFLAIFTVITVLFNCAMFAIVTLNYKQQMKREKMRACTEETFVSANIYRDLVTLEEGNHLTYEAIANNFKVYQSFYEKQNICLELWNHENPYNTGNYQIENREELNTEEGMQNLIVRTIDGKKYLFVASSLAKPYDTYQVVVSYSLEHIENLRQQMLKITFAIDGIMLIIIMVILYLIVKKMMHPLELLSAATTYIAEGDYTRKIEIKGEDEFAILATQFNRMSDCISKNILDLEQENETKKRLIDNMAHELRTPLTAIMGYAEYLKMANVKEEEKIEVLDYIYSQGKRLENLSNTLLSLARIREEEREFSKIEIRDLFKNLERMFYEKVSKKQIEIQFEQNCEFIDGNKEMILLLLVNLIENASRACEESGRIQVFVGMKEKQIILSVKDNGIGMTQEDLQKIDQPFYRVDKARSRKNGGVGLGVTLCKQIAQYHNGNLHYESELTKGTTAIVSYFTT